MFRRNGNRYEIPKVDNFEASVLVAPRDLRPYMKIATGMTTHDTVIGVCESKNGAYLTLKPQRGPAYEIHRRTPVPVIHD